MRARAARAAPAPASSGVTVIDEPGADRAASCTQEQLAGQAGHGGHRGGAEPGAVRLRDREAGGQVGSGKERTRDTSELGSQG